MKEIDKRIGNLSPEKLKLLKLKMKGKITKTDVILPVGKREWYSLTDNQDWFLSLVELNEGESAGYNVHSAFEFNGKFCEDAYERSLNKVIERHEILRANFVKRENGLVQVFETQKKADIRYYDLREAAHQDLEEASSRVDEIFTQHMRMPFDMANDLLMRSVVVRLKDELYRCLNVIQHLVTDLVSFDIFQVELGQLYNEYANGVKANLLRLPVQFSDFSIYQNEKVEKGYYRSSLEFWRSKLEGLNEPLPLKWDYPRRKIQTFNGDRLHFEFESEMVERLLELSRDMKITLFTLHLAVIGVMLYKRTGEDRFAVGTPLAGMRDRKELQNLIGLFLNPVAVLIDIQPGDRFRDLVFRVKGSLLESIQNGECPFGTVVRELRSSRDLSYHPFFQVNFFYIEPSQDVAVDPQVLGGTFAYGNTARYDAAIAIYPSLKNDTRAWIEYNTDLFKRHTIEDMLSDYLRIIRKVTECPDVLVEDLSESIAAVDLKRVE